MVEGKRRNEFDCGYRMRKFAREGGGGRVKVMGIRGRKRAKMRWNKTTSNYGQKHEEGYVLGETKTNSKVKKKISRKEIRVIKGGEQGEFWLKKGGARSFAFGA